MFAIENIIDCKKKYKLKNKEYENCIEALSAQIKDN